MRRAPAIAATILAAVAIVAAIAVLGGVFDSDQPARTPAAISTAPSAPLSIAPGVDPQTTTQHPGQSTPPPKFPPPFASVDPTDPIAVMQAGLQMVFTYRPASDATQIDAARRALPLLGPAGVDAGFASLAPITGAQWRQWKTADAAAIAAVAIPAGNDNPDQPTTVSRTATVTHTVVNRAGRPVGRPPVPFAVYATVTKNSAGTWHITRITVQQ